MAVTHGDTSNDERTWWLLRLETWIILSLLTLVFQLFPALFWGLLYAIDARNWTWGVWVGLQVAVVAVLVFMKIRHDESA